MELIHIPNLPQWSSFTLLVIGSTMVLTLLDGKFSWEMMEKEAEVMKFISKNEDLYDQMKLLSNLERTSKDTTATLDGPNNLLERQNKVENLKEVSLWNTTYDYVGIDTFGKNCLRNFQ
ncbi:hypothetical protein ACLB2K_071442 [Fragaria x ananassa]